MPGIQQSGLGEAGSVFFPVRRGGGPTSETLRDCDVSPTEACGSAVGAVSRGTSYVLWEHNLE